MPGFQFFDVILLAMVAGFIAFRLYSVLGRRTGTERPHDETGISDRVTQPDTRAAKPTENFSGQIGAPAPVTGPVGRALMDIKLADRKFDAERFLEGARAAYEMIVTAFAKGDRETLKPLLSDDVFHSFDVAMTTRDEKSEPQAFTFGGLKSARITGAALKDRSAEVTVTFESEGTVAAQEGTQAGNPAHAVTDVWTFARDTSKRDPNWTLIATASG